MEPGQTPLRRQDLLRPRDTTCGAYVVLPGAGAGHYPDAEHGWLDPGILLHAAYLTLPLSDFPPAASLPSASYVSCTDRLATSTGGDMGAAMHMLPAAANNNNKRNREFPKAYQLGYRVLSDTVSITTWSPHPAPYGTCET